MSRLLIMEDDLVDRMALTRMLIRNIPLIQTTVCCNVSQTVDKLQSNDYEWIISDYNLPDGTIQDILPFIKNSKLICVSGELEAEKTEKLKSNGLYKLFIKDQHLDYLETIKAEILSSYSIPIKVIEALEPKKEFDLQEILQRLNSTFGEDKNIKIEILEIFKNDIYPNNISKLVQAIEHKDTDTVSFLSHKLQSTFRILGAKRIIAMLWNWEKASASIIVDWIAINENLYFFKEQTARYNQHVISAIKIISKK